VTARAPYVVQTAACAAILSGAAALAAAQPAGIHFPANAYTTSSQVEPAVAMDADGNFVVVWESFGQDGHFYGLFGRRFDLTGRSLGPEFQVNSYTTDMQRHAAIAMRPSGEFVVVWQSHLQDGSFGGVFGRTFDASGNATGPEFQVNDDDANAQRQPAAAMDDDGGFVVAWQGYTPGGLWDVWARTFDAAGNPIGSQFVVNAYTTDVQGAPSVAMDGAGNFVVVWETYRKTGLGMPCHFVQTAGRRFDATGVPLGADFSVGTGTTQGTPEVAVADGGGFVVAWQDDRCGYGGGVWARLFDASASPVSPEIAVDVPPPPIDPDNRRFAGMPSVAADDAGTFVVAWHRTQYIYENEYAYGYYDHHIRARRYDALGNPFDPGSVASPVGPGPTQNIRPSVAARVPGRFIVAWQSFDGDLYGVQGRSPDVIFADGFETGDVSSWHASVTDAGDLAASAAAKMGGPPSFAFGLRAVVDDQASLLVQDDTPTAEPRYRARFYLDPNGFDPGESVGRFRQHLFLAFSQAPQKRLVLIMLRRIGGQYAIGAHLRRDDDTLAKSSFVPITDDPHAVEFDWQQASAAGADDGRFELWIDGLSVLTLTGLDNDERAVDFVRMGALSVKAGAAGTLYFDEFVSRRLAYIGP
jgi:hypothetical protein